MIQARWRDPSFLGKMAPIATGNAMFGFRRKPRLPPPPDPGGRITTAPDRWFADADQQFRAFAETAGHARNRGEFAAAAAAYRQALRLDPRNPGCWAALAYVHQEMADWCAAEVALRTAMALGWPNGGPALAFLIEKAGGTYHPGWTGQVEAFWRRGDADHFAAPPTRNDVADAIELLCDRGDPSDTEIRDLLRASPSRRALLARLLRGEECRRYHADLGRLIAETGWAG
jgi:tetratricopeptide (TPR) repeat protein